MFTPRSRRLTGILFVVLSLGLLAPQAWAQARIGTVFVRVALNHADWAYKPGEPVTFKITVIQDGQPVPEARVTYSVGPEMMPPTIEKTVTIPADGLLVEAGTLKEPGFLRCVATTEMYGRKYRGLATAGFEPEQIKPTTTDPSDFDAFWSAGKEALAKVPLDARLTLLPEFCTAKANVFLLSLQNVSGDGSAAPSRLYGILAEPKAEGKYPAVLEVPGAGIRPYLGRIDLAERGIITLQIGIHGLPVNLSQEVYGNLGRSAVASYWAFNLDNKDRYYYRRVYLGCLRANDFLVSHPKFDGTNLAVTGGSQGGALSIVTAGLDPRVKALAAYYPALSDVTGYLHNRAGGWPHMFRLSGEGSHRTPDKIETSRYYDVVNFARRVTAPGLYTWGFNDETCPPTSMFSAYNVITAKKELLLTLETGHNQVPEQTERVNEWLVNLLKPQGAEKR
ncbi:MAG: acetylxylan esterase [Acidobacteria bacterium]|nr:acetylxylan esterase [Acidobacteriota bacterium]